MGRANLPLATIRNPVLLTRAKAIHAKLLEHDAALDQLVAGTGTGDTAADPTVVSDTIIRTIVHNAADDTVKATSTFNFVNGAFTAADVGRRFALEGTSGGLNDLIYTIATVVSGTQITTTVAAAADETFGVGVTQRVLQRVRTIAHDAADTVVKATKTWTFTNGAFVAADVGRKLEIRLAADALTNKTYTIASRTSGTVITTTEEPGANETFGVNVLQRVLESVGIMDVTKRLILIDGRGTMAFVLPDGTRVGQELTIRVSAAVLTTSAVITPTHMTDGLVTITMDAANDWADLIWTAAGWRVVKTNSVTLA